MNKNRFVSYITVLLLAGLLSFSMSSAAEVVLNFGVYSSDKPTAMIKKFRPVLNAIESRVEESLGLPVTIRMQVAKSYEQGVSDLVTGQVDFARFGPASYIQARAQAPEIEILAMESKKGEKVFNGVICIASDSNIRKISDLKGKRFAFGNERSTTGRYLSQLYLMKHGLHASDFEHYEYLDRHDLVASAVALGNFDAGALKENSFNKMLKKDNSIKVLARFPCVTKPWIARSGLPESYRQALRNALLMMDDEAALKTLKKDGFLPGDDSDFESIREAMLHNKQFFEASTLSVHRN